MAGRFFLTIRWSEELHGQGGLKTWSGFSSKKMAPPNGFGNEILRSPDRLHTLAHNQQQGPKSPYYKPSYGTAYVVIT